MEAKRVLRSAIAFLLAVAMLTVSMPITPVMAGMVPTEQVIEAAAAEQSRDAVMQYIAREEVRQQMRALGVDPDEAAARVKGLSDAEVQQIAGRLQDLPAGESAGGTIIGIFLAVLIILIITDIFGWTDVYSFITPVQ